MKNEKDSVLDEGMSIESLQLFGIETNCKFFKERKAKNSKKRPYCKKHKEDFIIMMYVPLPNCNDCQHKEIK